MAKGSTRISINCPITRGSAQNKEVVVVCDPTLKCIYFLILCKEWLVQKTRKAQEDQANTSKYLLTWLLNA